MKVVLVPLSKADQKTLDEDDALMRYMNATEVVPASDTNETVITGAEDMDEGGDEDAFRSKQVEAAKALRARLKRGDDTIETELEDGTLVGPSKRLESAMDEDEPIDDENANEDDDEVEERDALGIDYDGRHYFEDAVKKKSLTGIDALPQKTGSGKGQDADSFFNQPEEADYEWELELIRRSGVKRAHQSIGNSHSAAKAKSDAMARVEVVTIPDRTMEPLSEDDIMKRIEKDMAQLQSVSSLHENRLATIEASREEHTTFLATADSSYTKATDDLQYFEDFKLYMLDLMDCIESKLPLIQDVEEKMFQTRQIRVRKTQARIRSAFPEELEAVRSGLDSSETSAWKMWRNMRPQRVMKSRNDFSYEDPQLDLEEGYSSDEETTPDSESAYRNALVEVRDASITAFEDTLTDFCNLKIILERLADFRSKYPISYSQSHISSQIAKLLGPIVRLDVVSWDPLKTSNILSWPWFECFELFVAGSQVNPNAMDDGSVAKSSDDQVLADICTEVLLPKVKDAIKFFWRPNSTKETETLQTLLNDLRHFLPPKPLSEILVAINMGLKHAISAFDLPSTQPLHKQTSNSTYKQIAFSRCLKLILIVTAWLPYFSPDAIRSLICDSIISEKIVPYFKSLRTTGLSERWRLVQLVVASLGPYLRSLRPEMLQKAMESLLPFDSVIEALGKDSLGHYDSFEISESVVAQWQNLHGAKS